MIAGRIPLDHQAIQGHHTVSSRSCVKLRVCLKLTGADTQIRKTPRIGGLVHDGGDDVGKLGCVDALCHDADNSIGVRGCCNQATGCLRHVVVEGKGDSGGWKDKS